MLGLSTDVTVDALEQQLLGDERIIAKARARQAATLTALDAAQVHMTDGSRSMIEWVAARLDVSHDTARLLTRSAALMADQPAVARRLATGEIGVERAVAAAELAGVAPAEIVEWSEGLDLGGVRRLVARYRGRTRRSDVEVFTGRFLTLQPSLDAGTLRGRFEVPGFDGEILTQAITERADLFADAGGPRIPKTARMADALVSISQDSLDTPTASDTPGRGEPVVSVFVDASIAAATRCTAGAELAAGPRVGPAVLEEMLCTGRVGVVFLQDGTPVSATPTVRGIPRAIRRFVVFRDGGCTVDGCRSRYRLQPHHIGPYAAGGSHHPDNLTTLCWYHHHVVVHGHGYRIDPDSPPGRRRFLRPNPGHDPPEG